MVCLHDHIGQKVWKMDGFALSTVTAKKLLNNLDGCKMDTYCLSLKSSYPSLDMALGFFFFFCFIPDEWCNQMFKNKWG